jgi:hypothetical protein
VGSNAVEEQTFPVDWSQLLWALYFNQVNGVICCQNQCSKNSLTTVMKLVWHDNDYVFKKAKDNSPQGSSILLWHDKQACVMVNQVLDRWLRGCGNGIKYAYMDSC